MNLSEQHFLLFRRPVADTEKPHLVRDHGSMAPNQIWSALSVSRQGAMDLLRPLIAAGLVEKVGGAKTGHYVLKNV